MIAGASTGGIIAFGLAKPNPVGIQDIIDLYTAHGSEICVWVVRAAHRFGPINKTAMQRHRASAPRGAEDGAENRTTEHFRK
jgi:patatin-like phospholipase/acyl hydrolase